MFLQKVFLARRRRIPRAYVCVTRLGKGEEIPRRQRPFCGVRWRLDVILRRADFGGHFIIRETYAPRYQFWRFILFRPDQYTYGVTKVLRGRRIVLSISIDW
jgi:hypothetical protein